MKKELNAKLIVICMLAVCFIISSIAETAQAGGSRYWKNKCNNCPIWKIFKNGTGHSVKWKSHMPNPRFLIYDAGTINDPFDDLVLDQETCLVWERAPVLVGIAWYGAIKECANRELGGRKGWHLPTLEQLGSVVDANNGYPALPTGHPFINADTPNPTNRYWSRTTDAEYPDEAYRLLLGSGLFESVDKGSGDRAWCVRGGQSFDGQN